MGQIQILDATLSNQIAAGEVVERPAAAAKELLENAVDAGATRIAVEVSGGGIERLRVTDNGSGMTPEDAALAVQRHATSKVRVVEDLNHINTLGFRGEALPSIASVSRFTLRTRAQGALGATTLRIEGGETPIFGEAGGPLGTDILVEDLFYNVPARRKFLKKPATEASHVQDAVQRLALCYPNVAFKFVKDGRTVFDLPPCVALIDRVKALFGAKITKTLKPVHTPGLLSIDGLIADPREAKATARHYHTFINGRFTRDRVLMSAIQAAYGGRLQRGRHPFVVLRLTLPPEAVDVNVHPAKTEVRFVDSGAVHRLVSRALDAVIKDDPWGVEAAPDAVMSRNYTLGAGSTDRDRGGQDVGLAAHRKRIFDVMERVGRSQPRSAPMPVARPIPRREPGRQADLLAHLGPRGTVRAETLKGARVLGRADKLLLCATADGVLVLDPAAAARCIAFETVMGSAQRLEVSQRLELDSAQAGRVEALGQALGALGFEISSVGGRTFALTAAPAGLAPESAADALEALLDSGENDAEALAWICSLFTPWQGTDAELVVRLSAVSKWPPKPPRLAASLLTDELFRKLKILEANA